MADSFYLAAVPDPQPKILGLQLLPFSLGHLILLHRYGSNFVSEEAKDPGFDDLAISVLVCSLNYRDGVALMTDHSIDEFMRRWHDRITGRDKLLVRFGWKKGGLVDLHRECARFAEYLQENTRIPYYKFSPGDFGEMHCPAVQQVKIRLMRDMHFTESEILDRPWSLCLWDYVTLKACQGEVEMVDKGDVQNAIKAGEDLARRIADGTFDPKRGRK